MSRSGFALIAAFLLTVAAVACGGDEDAEPTPGSSSYTATISEAAQLAIGPERFVFLLEDARGAPVTNASAHLRFYYIDPVRDDRETLKNDLNATAVELDNVYELRLADGSTITQGPGATGLLADEIAFDQAGEWIVNITGSAGNNSLGSIEVPFSVADTDPGPRRGQAAPALNGSTPIGPAMIIFGTAGECATEVCGPLVEIAVDAAARHSGEIAVQTLALSDGASWGVVDAPAVFFIDADGFVRGHLHTIASETEVEELAQSLLP